MDWILTYLILLEIWIIANKIALISLFAIKAAFCMIVGGITYFTFKSKPRKPPSEAATAHRDDDILGTIRLLYTNRQFMLLTSTHIFYMTSFEIMRKNWRKMLSSENYTTHEITDFELIRILSGLIGSLVLGILLHCIKLYKTTNIWLGFLSLVGWVLIPFIFKMDKTSISILYGYIGFSNYPINPFWYVYSVEVAYPLKETTVVGVVRAIAVVLSNSIAYTCLYFLTRYPNDKMMIIISSIMAFCSILGMIWAMIIKPMNYETVKSGNLSKFMFIFIFIESESFANSRKLRTIKSII